MSTLDRWLRDGWLRPLDHALGSTLLRLRPHTPEPVVLAAALASRAVAFGHSTLPLDRVPDLFAEIAPERAPPSLPSPDEWSEALRASDYFAGSDDTRGSVLVFADRAVSLRRYHDYEVRLARALCALAGPIGPA
ncbi:MAG: exodeoxyribonuclease V subunit alpha, partial [Rhodanobacteraceae bacterium]